MNTSSNILNGVVRGKTIELERDAGLPDGQAVSVSIHPTPGRSGGASLRRAFGAWADDSEELDGFLLRLRRDRQQPRSDSAA